MSYNKLLVLCCHGVYHQGNFFADRPHEKDVYLEHIKLAFSLLKRGKFDVLIISGGYTKSQVEKSEARGYLDWADKESITEKDYVVLLEESARTSAENLLFGMCRFYQYFGYFPDEVGSCTLSWKHRWHQEAIAPALKLPKFQVLAVDLEEEEKILEDLNGLFLDPTKVFEDNKGDSLELRKDVSARDIWKKGQSYASMEIFSRLFEDLEKIKKNANSMSTEQLQIEVKALTYPWS